MCRWVRPAVNDEVVGYWVMMWLSAYDINIFNTDTVRLVLICDYSKNEKKGFLLLGFVDWYFQANRWLDDQCGCIGGAWSRKMSDKVCIVIVQYNIPQYLS